MHNTINCCTWLWTYIKPEKLFDFAVSHIWRMEGSDVIPALGGISFQTVVCLTLKNSISRIFFHIFQFMILLLIICLFCLGCMSLLGCCCYRWDFWSKIIYQCILGSADGSVVEQSVYSYNYSDKCLSANELNSCVRRFARDYWKKIFFF